MLIKPVADKAVLAFHQKYLFKSVAIPGEITKLNYILTVYATSIFVHYNINYICSIYKVFD